MKRSEVRVLPHPPPILFKQSGIRKYKLIMISHLSLSQPNIKTSLVKISENLHTLVIEPLLPGYGHTLGNSIRRVLLSSVPGSAVTKIKINEITHEYQAVEGVVEDALDIILNLKLIRAKILTDDEKVTLILTKNKEGEVLAKDFAKDAKVEIVNPEQYICFLNKDAKVEIEIEISKGVGYLSVEEINLANNANPQDIYVDAVFSPVVNSSINVEQVRVGDKTNFDKLSVSFETDKSVSADEVVEFIFNNLIDLFSKILSSFQVSNEPTSNVIKPAKLLKSEDVEIASTDTINLPAKIKNILEKNDVKTNSELIARLSEVEEFAGITEKTFTIIKDYIKTIA